ncbi:histidine phosphatase family protein [Nocardia amamiensis]|uniref:histidine phosphatase family protein n=1 Tax=Nocardia amamiensis TaxID=404578 RepID=UPI0035A21D10
MAVHLDEYSFGFGVHPLPFSFSLRDPPRRLLFHLLKPGGGLLHFRVRFVGGGQCQFLEFDGVLEPPRHLRGRLLGVGFGLLGGGDSKRGVALNLGDLTFDCRGVCEIGEHIARVGGDSGQFGAQPLVAVQQTCQGGDAVGDRESWSNVDGVVAGPQTCLGLTERGHDQARTVGEYLAAERHRLGTTVVYSTAVRRAVQTAEPIAHQLGVQLRPEFSYNEHGTAEGHRRNELIADPTHPLTLSPDYPIAAGADSWPVAAQRVGRKLDTLTTQHPGTTVVVACHRETILAAAQHFQRIPPTLTYASAEVDYTAITEWEHRPRTRNPHQWRWVLIRHNDTRHLWGSSTGQAAGVPL